jgi:hypothetical protein
MNSSEKVDLRSVKHRGCGIRAASYSVGPQSWLPEASVWLETESGLRRLWVHSFAHCFDAEKLTFSNKLDADSWALGAARTIIDRELEQCMAPTVSNAMETVKAPPVTAWQLAGYPMRALARLKSFRLSN